MYKFFGTPNMMIKGRKKQRFSGIIKAVPLFRFDSNGEYITDDADLIKKLKTKFKYEEIQEEEVKKYKCKKCDFETDNMGALLTHYKTEHPKEEKG